MLARVRAPVPCLPALVFAAALWTLVSGPPRPCLAQTPSAMTSTSSTYGAPRIRLKGKAHVDMSVSKSAEVRIISGTVTDDTLRPFPSTIALTLGRGFGAADTRILLPLATVLAQPCAGDEHPVLETSTRLTLPTDASGRFCVRLRLAPDRYVARVVVPGTPLLDEDVRELSFDSSRDAVTLRFESEPLAASLDADEISLEVDAFAEQEHGPTPASGLVLELTNASGSRLGEATTDAFGEAHFHVPTALLGSAGMATLRVTFAGDVTFGPSARDVVIEKRTRVRLALPDARGDGTLSPGRPEDGIALRVRVAPGARQVDASPTGVVEARVGATLVGAGVLTHGEARFVATFATRGVGPVPISLRYVPDVPWLEPQGELHVLLPVRGPRLWTRLATILAGFAALGWFVVARLPAGWLLRGRPIQRRDSAGRPAAGRRATVVTGGGWRGRVVDAHDGSPIAGARVRIERPTFRGSNPIVRTLCGADGRFVLPAADVLPGDRLVAEADLHAPLRQTLPPQGEVAVGLVLRRRALVDRLVLWARRHHGPFDGRPEPTPSEIRDAARGESGIARWAEQVEHAAFGALPVDADRQAEVDRLAPDRPSADARPSDDRAERVDPSERAR